jgi:hypothetical protein
MQSQADCPPLFLPRPAMAIMKTKSKYHPHLVRQAKHRFHYLRETKKNLCGQLGVNLKQLNEILQVPE